MPAASQLLKGPTGPEKSEDPALEGLHFLLIHFSQFSGDSCKGTVAINYTPRRLVSLLGLKEDAKEEQGLKMFKNA